MRTLALCLILLFSVTLFAQQNLADSRRNSVYQYAYKLHTDEALTLYRSGMYKVGENYLHTLVDSSLTDSMNMPLLAPGNYLLVQAKENKLHYELKTISGLRFKLVNNSRDLVIALHDKEGRLLTDARVYLNKKQIPYDAATHTFRLPKQKKKGDVYVYYKGVVHCFPLAEQGSPYKNQDFWYRLSHQTPLKYVVQPFKKKPSPFRRYPNYYNQASAYEKNFRGFMVFSKPMYKPNDTVRLKAYVMNKKGRGLQKKMLVRITDRYLDIDTIVAVISPYRNGGYEYSFVLSDSLDLDLDEDYLITLEEERSRKYNLDKYDGDLDDAAYALQRKIVMRGKFRYEEYELKSTDFTLRSDKKQHNRGEFVSIFAKATDENDLPVLDGRISITVTTSGYAYNAFRAPKVFLPDTLWQHTMPLENIGETRISLPDSIFPAVSFDYHIHCTFLNANNESQEETLYQSFNNNRHKLQLEAKNDSLFVDYLLAGQPATASAKLYVCSQQKDTLLTESLSLPARLPLHPFAQYYEVSTDSASAKFTPAKADAKVYASAVRTRDSILVQLVNPARLPVWYTIFAGNKVVHRGYGDSLLYVDKVRTPKNYFVSLQYIYGDKVCNEDYTVPFRDKLLNIAVKQPQFVYPGQTANISIAVTNSEGKPVENADVTAYAFTDKFTGAINSATRPNVPYLGKYYPMRKRYNNFTADLDNSFAYEGKLNWDRWSREMGLDSIEYFKFLHPLNLYTSLQPAKDSITQIAPFVVKDGELQPVHHIYIDERPVFFSQSQHLERYSFPVAEGKHALRLRTPKQLISLDSIMITKGMKTILCINADTANKMVHIQPMPDTLTANEKALWSRYMIIMENNFGENLAVIRQDNTLYLPNFNDRLKAYTSVPVLIGPLTNRYAQLTVKNRFEQSFEVEGGYLYNISKGLIKQKQLRNPYPFNTRLSYTPPAHSFKDFVLTAQEVDSLWQDYLDHRSAHEDLFRNPDLNKTGNGQLIIGINKDGQGQEVFVKNSFLFRYNEPDFVRVYKGETRNFGFVQPGNYRLFLLLKGDAYFIVDSIKIQKDGVNYYETGVMLPRQKDSISLKIAAIVNNREKGWRQYKPEDLDSIKETFNAQFMDAGTFSRTVVGQVKDEKGQPVAGASVIIKGTRRATTTDAMGNFRLDVPERATLEINSVGYSSVLEKINDQSFYTITLIASNQALHEVVVVGYGTQKKMNMTGAVASVTSEPLLGRLAGIDISQGDPNKMINIRGVASASSSSSPLIIVDGMPFSGTLADLDPARIASTNVLTAAAAIALYGANGANGVLLITTKKAKEAAASDPMELMAAVGNLRRNFRDHAYWQPKLRTDAEGKASFAFTFPDDITNWQTHVAAVTGNKQTGYTAGSIKSFKALSANLGLPQFAVEGDTIHVIAKTLNYLPDSFQVKRTFSYNGNLVKESRFSLRNSWIDTFPILAYKGDSLAFKYTVQKEDGYFDGEERKLPVYKQGVLETRGFFATLEGDTSFTITTDSSLGTVKFFAGSSVLPILENEIESIRNYEYLCNEQLASKLKALLLQKRLCTHLEKGFDGEKNIKDLISRLNQNKSQNLWGWWSNNQPMPWISLHVAEALLMAEQAGYKTNINNQVVTDYLVYQLESYRGHDKLFTLNLLHTLGAKIDYNKYLDTLQKQMTSASLNLSRFTFDVSRPSLYNHLRLLELKQKTGAKISLDTLVPKARRTMFGNLYWGEENRLFFDNSVQVTLLMYRLMRTAGGYETELKKVRNYFLEKRKDGAWRNTYESSLILETILPDLLMQDKASGPVTLTVTGTKSATVQEFPFAAEISPGQKITINKKGSQPVYFTAYQQYWNPNPQKVSGDFTVTSSFERNGQTLTALKAGEQMQLKVAVDVQADADYIMIEIPIPAACSYADKSQSYRNNEVHREYFKNKVSIFCSTLKKGAYTFTVSLLPRYNGAYHLNPAKAELMYFPTFFGREALRKVNVF